MTSFHLVKPSLLVKSLLLSLITGLSWIIIPSAPKRYPLMSRWIRIFIGQPARLTAHSEEPGKYREIDTDNLVLSTGL
jgi:hypothetical protein